MERKRDKELKEEKNRERWEKGRERRSKTRKERERWKERHS